MDSLSQRFEDSELLYRAVRPNDMYWKENGKLSSAAFKDRAGLSVLRGYGREDFTVVGEMRSLDLVGEVVKVTVLDCRTVKAVVKYLPSRNSKYHSEIHGSNDTKLLSDRQCKILSDVAVLVSGKRLIS